LKPSVPKPPGFVVPMACLCSVGTDQVEEACELKDTDLGTDHTMGVGKLPGAEPCGFPGSAVICCGRRRPAVE
jgi:hypothetical protein